MIEKTILDYLGEEMSVPVSMEENGDGEFVLIRNVGGREADHIRTTTFEFTVFGSTLYRAAELCEELIVYMNDAAALPSVSRSHYGGSYDATFVSDKTYRYKAIYEITHY